MKVGPSHLIIANEAENAIPLNARDAMRGSPSPWKVFAITPMQARDKERRDHVSVEESAAEVMLGFACRGYL